MAQEGHEELEDPEAKDQPIKVTLFERLPIGERNWLLPALRDETVGGVLLLIATVIALVWVNSPWGDSYIALSEVTIGPDFLHLNLTLAEWAADGLLAVFFFIAGVELRHELELGTLANPAKAAVPIAAAIGGMVVPAAFFVAINASTHSEHLQGWGIPMATDIAFALAVLAVVGRRLPVALRAFLLSLAVVDDLGAITVIAVFYSEGFIAWSFFVSLAALALYWVLQRERFSQWWVYVLLAVVAWVFMLNSGVHATVAGVLVGLLTRVRTDPGEEESPGARAEHKIRPVSAAICVPIFAFFAAGVDLRDANIIETIGSPVALGVIVGLVLGKPIGVVGTAWVMARFTKAKLSEDIRWRDVIAIGMLAGIGFTVSLLIAELAFPGDIEGTDAAKIGILLASVLAAGLATLVILSRNRYYAVLAAREERDEDHDGVPDVYQQEGRDDSASPTGPQEDPPAVQ